MDPLLLDAFRQEARRAFAFLVEDYHFAEPVLWQQRHDLARVIFHGNHVSIECVLDTRDEDISVHVSKVIDGVWFPGYTGPDGRRVRYLLSEYLTKRGVRDLGGAKAAGLSLGERIPVILAARAQELRVHGQDLLADSPHAFDGLPRRHA